MVTVTDITQALLMAALDEPEEKSRRLVLADALEEAGYDRAGYLLLPGTWHIQFGGEVYWAPDRRPDPYRGLTRLGLITPDWDGFRCHQPEDPVGLQCERITRIRFRGQWLCLPCAARQATRLIRATAS